MTTITEFMESDHRRCDELFAAAERLVAAGEWSAAADAYAKFHSAIEHHFSMEEDELFPAFEDAMGSTMGPTQVMRMEHGQMRALFERMRNALAVKEIEDYLGASDTLLILMQQHNMKEEQMLYPMSERTLADGTAALLQRMQAVG
jgi:hemerythrin-like domain-containing protein